MLIFLLLLIVVGSTVVRALTATLRFGVMGRRGWSRFGYRANPYRYGCRRHHGLYGRLLPIAALVVLDRMFGPRW